LMFITDVVILVEVSKCTIPLGAHYFRIVFIYALIAFLQNLSRMVGCIHNKSFINPRVATHNAKACGFLKFFNP